MKIVYDPEVFVYHHRRALFGPHLKQVSRYAFQRGYFVRAFPETSLKPGYFVPSLFLLFVVAGLVLAFASKTALVAWAAVMVLYGAALLGASFAAMVHNRDITVGVVTAPGIFLTHLIYGYNFLRGLLSGKSGIEAA